MAVGLGTALGMYEHIYLWEGGVIISLPTIVVSDHRPQMIIL